MTILRMTDLDLAGKRVLIRQDLNVPVADGRVASDQRIVASIPTLKHYGVRFFTQTQWQPDADQIGVAAVVIGTVEVAMVAMVLAIPLAVLTALYITEYAAPRWRGCCSS